MLSLLILLALSLIIYKIYVMESVTFFSRYRPRIGIIEVIEAQTSLYNYTTAITSAACYAKIHRYDFRIINDSEYRRQCPQKDKFFRRHCVVAEMLQYYDYILFLDADIGVVNPKRLIEEYLDPNAEIIFYDRFYNWEIMAGSYVVRNSKWSEHFLHEFANYESRVLEDVVGSDNGALHAYLAQTLFPYDPELPTCLRIFNSATDIGKLFLYEACIRNILSRGRRSQKIKILHKGTGWARDHRMTNSKWSKERDFMIHNWKTRFLQKYHSTPVPAEADPVVDFCNWYNPFAGEIYLDLCYPGNTSWSYDSNLIETRATISARLDSYEQKVENIKAKVDAYLIKLSKLWSSGANDEKLQATLGTLSPIWENYVV